MEAPSQALCNSVCRLQRDALAGFLCSSSAQQLLQGVQFLCDTQMRPDVVTHLCCARNAAGGRASRLRLGSFLAEQQQDGTGRVRRIVCGCSASCHCGRWQCQSQDRIPVTDSYAQYTVVRETLRWHEWSEKANKFVAAQYMVYAYSIEAGCVELLSPELQRWVGGFQWRQRESCNRPTRITFCQAFLDTPRRHNTERAPRGTSARRNPRATHNATHIATHNAIHHATPSIPSTPPTPPQRRDLTSVLAAAVDHAQQQHRTSSLSDLDDWFAELEADEPVVLFSGFRESQGQVQQGSAALESQAVDSAAATLFLSYSGECWSSDEDCIMTEDCFTSGESFEVDNLEVFDANLHCWCNHGTNSSPGYPISTSMMDTEEMAELMMLHGLSAAAA